MAYNFPHARAVKTLPPPPEARPADEHGDGPFWCARIGSSAAAALALAQRIDLLAEGAAQLPMHASLTRPVVGQYLSMVKALAAAWLLYNRPALALAIQALLQVGAGLEQALTPAALQRRLAAALLALEALGADLGAALAQLAPMAVQLAADTSVVRARLQADQVQVLLLLQQNAGLQNMLEREHLQRALAQLRADQGATMAQADYLDSVLPGVAPYLAALAQLGAEIGAAAAGARALDARLGRLWQIPAATLARQRGAAMAHWRSLAAQAASLHGKPVVTTPGATRTWPRGSP